MKVYFKQTRFLFFKHPVSIAKVAFALFFPTFLNANVFKLTTYQVEQGLPNNITRAVWQDKDGFMWIATDVGVVRYDGNNFMHLNNKLASPYIKNFYQTRNGDLFVIHDMGIDKIINKFDTVYFSKFLHSSQSITDTTLFYPKNMYEDSFQNIWISEPEWIVRVTDGKLKRYSFGEKNRSMNFMKSFQFVEDGKGNFLVFSKQGYVYLYDRDSDSFKELDIKLPALNDAIKMKDGKTWIAHEDGISELRVLTNGKIISLDNVISLKGVNTIEKDRVSDMVYIGTELNGVFKLSANDNKRHLKKIEVFKYKVVSNFYINSQGDVWVTSDEGVALLYMPFFSKVNVHIENKYIESLKFVNGKILITNGFTIKEIQLKDEEILSKELFTMQQNELILASTIRENTLFFGTSSGYLYSLDLITHKTTKTKLLDYQTSDFCLITDKKNNIWACVHNNKVLKITPDNKWIYYGEEEGIKSRIGVVRETPNGIYCGGVGKDTYLYRYDEVMDDFININPKFTFETDEQFEVQDLCLNNKNEFYLATNKDGLLRISKDKKIEKVDIKQKQEILNIKSLVLGADGSLWIGTDLGLIQYYNDQFLLFDEFNGLPSNAISYRSLALDNQNQVWVGSANGVAHTQKRSHKKQRAPIFLSLKMNGNKFTRDNIKFENNSFLEATFVSLVFPSKNITYQYRVIGLSETWFTLNHNELTLPKLTAGTYRLEIRASQQGEYLWSDPLTVDFTIELAWYLNWWAISIFISALISIVWLIVKLNTMRLVKTKQRLESIIQKRTSEIVNQKEEIISQRDAIENALEEIKALNATKDRFFSIVAHDLRGPLNSFVAFSSLLIEHTDSLTHKDIKKVGTQLNKEVRNTIELTENLLTWARAQMSQSSFNPAVLDLNNVVDQNIILLTTSAQNKNIELKVKISDPITVYADVDHVNFIIRNLIGNAIKFTFSGGTIQVLASIKENMAEVSIKDSGVGMSPQVAQKIFNIDSNHSTKGTGGEKGTGLGLTLCRDFVKHNGGTIWVESEQNVGSTFSFTLRLTKNETNKSSQATEENRI